jgi:hypothetical protein
MGASWYWEPLREAVFRGRRRDVVPVLGRSRGMARRRRQGRQARRPRRGPVVRFARRAAAHPERSEGRRGRTRCVARLRRHHRVVRSKVSRSTSTPAKWRLRAAKLFAELLTIRVAENDAPERGESDEEPQDTPMGPLSTRKTTPMRRDPPHPRPGSTSRNPTPNPRRPTRWTNHWRPPKSGCSLTPSLRSALRGTHPTHERGELMAD